MVSILLLTFMRKMHILFTGVNKRNSLPLSLMLESYNFHLSVNDREDEIEKVINNFKSEGDHVDMMIFGTDITDSQLENLFSSLSKQNKSIPFIIISDSTKFELMSHLLNEGFYGYLVRTNNLEVLVEQVNTIFTNLNKYKDNEK